MSMLCYVTSFNHTPLYLPQLWVDVGSRRVACSTNGETVRSCDWHFHRHLPEADNSYDAKQQHSYDNKHHEASVEKPRADWDVVDRTPLRSKKSILTRKKVYESSQCRMPPIEIRGMLHLYGNCRKYVLRCRPTGLVTRRYFLDVAKRFHSCALAITVHIVLMFK